MSNQIKYSDKLKSKQALIIGGTSGIGFAVAEALLESGAIVIVSSSSPEKVESAVVRLKSSYPSATVSGRVCDLSNSVTLEDNIKALFASCDTELDHVIHTAGDMIMPPSLTGISIEQIIQTGMVRFFAPLLMAKYLPQHVKRASTSSFTITSGATAEKPQPGWAVITSFASGLHGMTRSLALDLKPIRVNVVSPGPVNTERWNMMPPATKEAFLANMGLKMPTGAVPGPEEVAEAYVYLCRDNNITGANISTSGGSVLV